MNTIQLKEVNEKEAILTIGIDLNSWKKLSRNAFLQNKLTSDLIIENIDIFIDTFPIINEF